MRIAKASRKAIEYACRSFHYSHSAPGTQFGYNIYNDADEWCVVILFGGGANHSMPSLFGMNSGEVLELTRVALNGKQEQTSQAVAMALRQLHRDDPLVRVVVSYADHRQRHIGTIYQATNWIYTGTITGNESYYYQGKWIHRRTLDNMSNGKMLQRTLPHRGASSKFRYIYCFDRKDRKRLSSLALPYPKDDDLLPCDMQVEERTVS